MCGISGVIGTRPLGESERHAVASMNDRLWHRGPDSAGIFDSGHVRLAMRRLAIIDLEGADQPIFNASKTVAVVCNGEIYNYKEIRRDLEAQGYVFRTSGDVETIAHAYDAFGLQFLEKIKGMFALALWDSEKNQLLLARDRLGEKPLYYRYDNEGALWFSSELRSLFSGALQRPEVSAQAFNLFMAFQYLPEPVTPLTGCKQLPAGSYLLVEPGSVGQSTPIRYWELSALRCSPDHAVARVEEKLDAACKRMGTADVPVAVALSGGIDSSLVAALSARHFPADLHAFTVGYAGRPATDERSQAAVLAEHLGIGFSEVEIGHAQVVDSFLDMVDCMDTPIADIAAFGYFRVSQASREAGFPVLMSGMGGDEFFWGYEWVRDAVKRNEAYRAERGWHYWWRRLKGKVPRSDFFEVHAALRAGESTSRQLLAQNNLPADDWLAENSLDEQLPVHLGVTQLLNRTWLQSNCLALVDRMSMSHSVEVRLPLLDVELVECVVGMRNGGMEDWNDGHKALLVKALANVLPAEVLQRRKQGFTPPVRAWMSGVIKAHQGLLSDGALLASGVVDRSALLKLMPRLDASLMYKLVLLECWSRLHVFNQSKEAVRAGEPVS